MNNRAGWTDFDGLSRAIGIVPVVVNPRQNLQTHSWLRDRDYGLTRTRLASFTSDV